MYAEMYIVDLVSDNRLSLFQSNKVHKILKFWVLKRLIHLELEYADQSVKWILSCPCVCG